MGFVSKLARACACAVYVYVACAGPALAQQVPNHSVPLGRGAGVTGYGSIGPCTTGFLWVWAGASADPTCRVLVGADLPNPGASSLGGVRSIASTTHQFLNAISTSGIPSAAQPTFADLASTPTTLSGYGITSPLPGTQGGTNNAFFQVSGPASSAKTYTFPNSSQTVAMLDLADQTLSGGANVTAQSLSTGNITVDCGSRPIQTITNGGAYTITAPASDGFCLLKVTNNGSAGATTFSGFSVGSNVGDALDTTNAHKFVISIIRAGGDSTYSIKALQ